MSYWQRWWKWLYWGLLVLVLTACQPEEIVVTQVIEQEVTRVVTETEVVEGEEVVVTRVETVVEEVIVEVTAPLQPTRPVITPIITREVTRIITELATATPIPPEETLVMGVGSPIAVAPTRTPAPGATPTPEPMPDEERVVEVEWPPEMRLKDSRLVRLALVPLPLEEDEAVYEAMLEMEDNQTLTQTVRIERPLNYHVQAGATLSGLGMTILPSHSERQNIVPGTPTTWRWSIQPDSAGRHALTVSLVLYWIPEEGNPGQPRERPLYSRGIDIHVKSFLGLSSGMAAMVGVAGLVVGGGLSFPLATYLLRPRRESYQVRAPNPQLQIEPHPSIELDEMELEILQAVFYAYTRLTLAAEFRSGYSGARTLLALPIHADGRTDAYTIVKIGELAAAEREYRNYESFVRHTLPPITARIQTPPTTLPRFARTKGDLTLAALRYTFIGEPGQTPYSLRQALLESPDPELLEKMFRTFGPNWWMQRSPYSFRLGQAYDRKLPAHFVLEPVRQGSHDRYLDGRQVTVDYQVGDVVRLRHFEVSERRPDRTYTSLRGQVEGHQVPLRLRWSGPPPANGDSGRIIATRETLLTGAVASFERHGLPDPLVKLPALLDETVQGTRAIIHGDLNLENVLIGPEGFVWLIDFAETGQGHPAYDFAHLAAQIIAHVIAPKEPDTATFLRKLAAHDYPLLTTLAAIAQRCAFDPHNSREYDLALFMSCLGAIKYGNLGDHQRGLLFVAAAYLSQSL